MTWKTAATIILFNTEIRQVLMMKRGGSAPFMPNSYVFPGGVVEAQRDAEFPKQKTNFDCFMEQSIKMESFPSDYPLRVAAVRELFEESGLLLVAYENCRERQILNCSEDAGLEDWRKKVCQDPKLFPQLFFGNTKMDIKSCVPWSNWLTPLKKVPTKRYDSIFFVVETKNSPNVKHCEKEMTEAVWTEPSKIIGRSSGKGTISLPPPQYYELLRLRLSVGTPLTTLANPTRITPQTIISEENHSFTVNIFPGDHCYIQENAEFVEPRVMPIKDLTIDSEETRPVHRMTYTSTPTLQYTAHELHLRNIEKIEGTHIFSTSTKTS
uniref:Nudix hydrolase domain-containing protein n=1 Tax=Ditylenchus dipsaci TaxID=166011 RepID=A0A915EC67_9BILA